MSLIALDFGPGLHGHFLEYVLNRYIFKVDANVSSIFQSSGACHTINTDNTYQQNKLVDRGHFSSLNTPYPGSAEKIIFIQHDPDLDFILLTNVYYRCHPDGMQVVDFNAKHIEELQKSMMFHGSDAELKNNWYTKLNERHFDYAEKQPNTSLPVHRFDYASFFNLEFFLLEIKKTANFLNHTFAYDTSLSSLWIEFLQKNQGYNTWQKAATVFRQIVSGQQYPIDNDWKIHAYINHKISKIFSLYDHPKLFSLENYPSNTKEVHNIIIDHIENFDKQW